MRSFWGTVLSIAVSILIAGTAQAKETKNVSFTFKNAEPVVFSHDVHLLKYNNNCRICHNAIFDLKKRSHFTMADMEKTKSCGACHTGIKAFSVSDEKSCVRCHKGKPRDVAYKVKGAGEAVFSHSAHIAKTGGKCRSCHSSVITGKDKNVTMAQMEKGKTCGACHNGKKAFTVAGNCGKCHKGMQPRDIIFRAKGATDAIFSHNYHLGLDLGCKDCHTKVFPFKAGVKHSTMADMEAGKSCGACHNGTTAGTVAGNCESCHKGFKPANVSWKTDAGDATFSHEFHLGMYKCAECHTKLFPYKAKPGLATMADMEGGKSCGGCHNGKDAFSVKTDTDCGKCHKM